MITKDGKTEKVKDHYASYKGHTPKKYTPGTTESTSAGESTSASTSVSESKSSETKTSETKATETKAKETKEENPEISNGPSGNNTVVTSSEDVISPGPGGE